MEPFMPLVTQFVHDLARPEGVAVGLKTVRELCARMPLLMTADLLQDLALYTKDRKTAVAKAARSLISLFREVSGTSFTHLQCGSFVALIGKLQGLALYKKDKEKAASTAARSLISLFREVSEALWNPVV
jgi:hypothetical protein